MDTADTSKGKRNDIATPQDTASADKVTESSEEWQEQEEKFSPTPSGNTGSEEDEHEQFALTRRDEAVSLVNKMEDDAEIAPEIELTISNWDTLFGEEGIVKTPLGEVKMGENQFAKLMRQGRESKLGMIKPTLENPDVIIEASSEAKEGSITKRGSSYIFVKAFRKSDGLRYYYFTSVTVSKEGKEVVVSSQEKSRNRLLRLLTDEEIIWRTPKDATTSSAEGQGLDYVQSLDAETATKGSGLTPQRISSADKVTESSEEWQEQEEKFSPTPSGNTGSEEETYTLSSETSENGESFYQNNDGNIDLADIPDEVFDKIGKPKAPFRLTPSMLKHVFDRHGKEMGLHHADDAIDFVLDVMDNFDHVRQGDKGAIIFSIENGRSRTGRRAVTVLLDSQRGEYYGIKTSGYERIEGLHKRPLLWEKGAKETSATGVAPANVTTNETQQGNELTGSASNHGNDPMGKVTESSEELQEKEDKFTPAPIEDGEDYVDYAARVAAVKAQHDAIKAAENATDTESQRLATDAALEGLKRAGVPVEVVSDEQAAVMLGEQKGVELSAKQKRALETASPAMQDHSTVVSSADGTKVLKDLDNTIEKYENRPSNRTKTFIGDVAKSLGATRKGSNSEYVSFETKQGKIVTIRLANHNAKVSNFDNNGELSGISIVLSNKGNQGIVNDGDAHIKEFYYPEIKLNRAEGKPLVEILKSIKQALYSGEYKDTTGLAEVQEVNVPRAELHMVYHGSGADFDAFDHSHMGEGEGQQAYGWGTYVTEVEGIGEQYAEANHGNLDFDEEAFYDEANEYIEEVFGSRDGLDYAYNDGGFEIFNVNRDPETLNYFLDYFKEHPNEFDSWEDPNEIDVSTLDEKGIEELGRALERSMDDVVQEDVQALFEKYMTVPARHLYSVEIPDDTGSNYLDYTKNYADDRSGINTDHLIDALYDEILATDDEHLYDSKQAKKELRKELSELAFSFGKDIYGDISSYLGSDKKASEFLHRQGIVGISYPAQYRSGGREDDARNYVIFDEEDLKITDHVQFMKTPSGTLYGWTVGGKIYLTKDGLNPNTPIHEYTHLWARAMKERNKEGWQSVKELLRDTPVWDEVLKDKNYQDILDDEDAIASEALSRISGKKNAEKMEAEARKMIDEAKDYVDKAKAISLLERMKSALKKFWNWVGKDLFGIKKFSSVDEITDRVLYDLANGTDLKGAASEKVEKQQVSTGSEEERAIIEHAKENGTYMKAPNGKPTRLTEKQWAQVRTKAFKSWFGDWEKAARIEKLRKSEPVEITGEEIAPSDELKQYKRNALEYGKTLRGEYTNEDTKETIALTGGNSRGGIREILQHDYKDIEHLQSIAAIPQIIEKSTYIDEAPNEDVEKYPGIKSFRYYVCGLKIGNNDYTVKAVIAVQNNGDRYYDHKLSSIEKGKLLSIIPTIQEAGIEDNLPLSIGKDRRLLSILQTNSSKVVDENGEPLVVHHSTDNEFDTFSKEKLGENTDQNASDASVAATAHIGFWFNTNDLTGTLFQERDVAGYLDVKEPYEFNSLESLVEDMSYYSSAEEFVDRLKEDGYDGIVVRKDEEMGGTSHVAFEPNQIKSATDNNGEFSQESDDIRYRESKGSSERTLVGIHNISADKLSKAIKQGGLANPSVAVIDISKQQHTGYGEISLIMPSDKINKRTGKNAGTFEGDAWTPMYPSVERQMSREGSLVMEHDIKALPNEMQLGVRNALRNWLDNRVDTKLSYLYLFQQGKAPDFETIKPKYNKEVHGAFGDIMHEVTNVYELSKNDIEKLVDLYVKTELNGDFDEFNQSYERNIAKHKEILSNKKPGSLRYEKALIYLRDAEEYGRPIDVLQRFVDEVWRDKNTQGRVSIEKTFDAANKKIKEDGLEHDYKKWTDGLNERYQTKEVIFDGFTPSGMRRYVPNTLENVSKLMKKQGRNASNSIGSSFSNFAASVMKANTSLDSIRKKKGKLTNDHQDLDDFEEKWQDVYVDLSRKLQPDANAYDDYGFARLQEAASKADPQAYLQKEYGVTLSDEDTQRLKDMVKAIKEERPSMYFETKFERPVTFDEFAAAVVPHNTDAEIKQQLRDAGLKVVEYEAGNEESRAKAVEEASKSDDIRFRQEERAARELAEVNERFNEELQKQIDGTLPAGHVYQLGMPGEILLAAGFPTMPIELSATRLSEKSRQANHIFKLSEVKDLVKEINNPIAIFRYGNNAKNVIVGIEHNGKQFLVGVHFNQSHRGMEISDVRGIFPKDNAEWLNWISQGKADYLNKEKIQTLIDQQRINLAEVDYLDLDSAANILKDFQNPTIDEKNHSALSENALSAEPSHDREAMRNEAVQLSDKLHTPIKIVEDVKDITHSNAEVERRKRNSKGWYDVRTGEVVVVLPNNRDVEDVAATVMHETVAHKGLRELVGEEHYDEFLDEVYEHLRGDLKQGIDAEAGRAFVDDSTKNGERAKSYEQHRRTAVDELFGDMAEKPFEEFSEGERTLWQKLKEVVRKLLDKFLESLKLPKWFELGDNELRYMLWRSKERLERGKEHPIDLARDMVMREELGLSDAARMRMGDTPDTFKARQRRAVEEKGIVMPGLNEAEVKEVDVPRHQYKNRNILDQARDAAIERYNKQVGTNEDGTPKWEAIPQEYNNYGISFFYEITPKALKSLVQHHTKSDNVGVHTAVLDKLHEVINGSIEYEEDPDVPKINGIRDISKGVNENVLIHRFIGTVRVEGKTYRVISKIKEYRETHINARPSTYQVTEIGVFDDETPNTPNGSKRANGYVHVAKLLKDVEKSYDSGKKVLDESRKADENPILYRDGEETEDIWKDKSMGLHERTTAAAMRLADKHQENKTLRNDAMRAIGNNLADLRKAMSLQRKFDMATVKRVSDLARVLMNNGYIGDMTQQEVKSLLAAVRNSVGHNDIDRDVQKVMEIMVKNQLRRAEKALGALETIKGSKVNAKGVKVQGKLDAAGAQLMEVFKKTRGWEKNDIEEAIADAQGRMSSDDATVAENATIEYAGLQFAMEYAEKIRDSKVEESRLKEEIKKSHEETSERNRNSESYRQYIASLQDAILQNKIERAEAYFNLVGRLSDGLRESMANATQFKKMEKMRINEIHHYANSDMQGMSIS